MSERFEVSETIGARMTGNPIGMGAALNLSELQIRILLWLYETTVIIEEELGFLYPCGVQWTFSQDENLGEYSDQAISRSLQRLEFRGLLLRSNYLRGEPRDSPFDAPPSRTTSVKLTAIGRDVAGLIAKSNKPDLNHAS